MVYCKETPQMELNYSHLRSHIPGLTVAGSFLCSVKLGNCICIYTHISV